MEKEIIFLIEESPEGGYEAKALGHSIYAQAESFEELKKEIVDAVKCHFKDLSTPLIVRLHTVKDELITV